MRKIMIKLNVDDDFELGMCSDCPFHNDEEYRGDWFPVCSLGWKYDECEAHLEDDIDE